MSRENFQDKDLCKNSEWCDLSLGEVIELKRGYDLPQKDRVSGYFPLVSSSGVSDYHATAKAKGPGVVTGRYGTIGNVYYIKDDYWPLNTTLYVRDFKGNDPRFISYFLSTIDFRSFSDKAAVPGLNRNHLHQALVRIPIDVNEQRAIAHILGTLDDKIELNRKRNETLEAMARALFKDWFVDFGPVRAKMEGLDRYLPADIWDLFPEKLDEEGKPEGWVRSNIGSEVTVYGGSTPSTKELEFWEGGEYHWATPKDLSTLEFPVLLDTGRKITEAGISKISSGLLPVGTVLLSSRAPIGYLAIAEVPTAINQGFIAMKCDGVLSNLFALFWCREYMDLILGNANGSTFQEISKSNFRPLPVIVPTMSILNSFRKFTEPLYRHIVENERESRNLAHHRDTLLPKLISGELRLGDVESFIDRAKQGEPV